MEIEPPHLNVPLYRRNWSALWFVVASGVCAWSWHRPTAVSQVLVSVLVGGLAFWFALGPAFNLFRYHQSRGVRALFLIASVAGVFLVMQFLVPFLHAYVSRIA